MLSLECVTERKEIKMKKVKKYLSEVANNITPYQWEEGVTEKALRFDANTMPFPPKCMDDFLDNLKINCPINEYADPAYTKLKQLIAKYESVNPEMITVTNSSDEAIDILAKVFLNPGDYFITTPPTYEMFTIQCEINRGVMLPVPLKKETWEVDSKEIIKKSRQPKVKLIFLVNPNNPTTSIIPEETVENIVNKSDAIVVVDEVYREFCGKSAVPLLKKYKNLVILRSFSKFAALAGARIGYLIADKKLSEKFDAIRFPMGVSFLSYKLAEKVLENDKNWIKQQTNMTIRERKRLTNELTKLGFFVYPSFANFLLVKVGKTAADLCQKLRQKNIIVRDRSSKKYLEGCIRITVRSKNENDQLLKTLEEIL